MDALADAGDLRYVLALQEATAVGMADGYAQATGRPAFLNLHTSAGVGNAIGNLTNAQANGTPLVVTAGQQHYGHIEADPLLSGDLVGLARSVSKWAHEVRSLRELGTVVRRAFHDAAAPPAGPVFVSLPMSTLEEEGDAPVAAASVIDHRSVAGSLDALADLLTTTPIGRLAIVVGDEIATSGALDEIETLAEALGAPVFGAPLYGRAVFRPAHPLWAGMLPMAAAGIRAALAPFQRVFFIGGKAFMVYPFSDGAPLPDGAELIHLSPDPAQLARTYATTWAASGDPKRTLAGLLAGPLPGRLGRVADAAAAAVVARGAARANEIATLDAAAIARYGGAPIEPMAAAHAVVRSLPDDTIVVDEAITTGGYVRGFHRFTEAGRYYFCRGGGLGWGMPASLGVSLAHGGSVPVLCAVGDGSAMYSPQALWTAAHENLPVVFTVFNNRQYLILKNNLRLMKGDTVRTGRFVAMDIVDPPVDYIGLATSLGVAATRVDHSDLIGDVVRAALASGRPHLVEIPISAPA